MKHFSDNRLLYISLAVLALLQVAMIGIFFSYVKSTLAINTVVGDQDAQDFMRTARIQAYPEGVSVDTPQKLAYFPEAGVSVPYVTDLSQLRYRFDQNPDKNESMISISMLHVLNSFATLNQDFGACAQMAIISIGAPAEGTDDVFELVAQKPVGDGKMAYIYKNKLGTKCNTVWGDKTATSLTDMLAGIKGV